MITASKQVLLTEDCIPERHVQPETMIGPDTAYIRLRADCHRLGEALKPRENDRVREVRSASELTSRDD